MVKMISWLRTNRVSNISRRLPVPVGLRQAARRAQVAPLLRLRRAPQRLVTSWSREPRLRVAPPGPAAQRLPASARPAALAPEAIPPQGPHPPAVAARHP